MFTEQDHYWMQQALELAKKAAVADEVPVGAVIVHDNQIIGAGYNQPISSSDPTAHAEIIALRAAAQHIKNYRLIDTTMYVTLEPCMMCAGAMVHARIKRLVYGAADPKTGAIVSQARMLEQRFLNHRVDYAGGLLADECSVILRDFFQEKRKL
jgi:tRNA(adenine34) deaminase